MNDVKRVRIGDAFDVETGSTPSTAVPEYWEDGKIKWITPFDLGRLSSTYIRQTSRKITEKGLNNSSAKLVPANSIIISTRAPIGYLAILAESMAFNQGCKALLPKEADSIEPLFVYYQLKTKIGEMNRLGSGSTFKEISKEKLLTIEIQLPPLRTQNQVARILDKADAAREKRRQANQLTEQFLQSAFLDMFGDYLNGRRKCTWKSTKDVASFIDYRGKTPRKSAFGIRLITAKNVKEGHLSDEPKEYIVEEDFEEWMTRGFPRENDVLFTTEAPLGNVAKLAKFEKVVVGQRIITLQPREDVTSDYLMFCLMSKAIQAEIQRRSGGSTAKGIRSKEFAQVKIPIPSFSKQQDFAALVEKTESLRAKQKESEKELENLFNSLMQKAFKGELV